MLSTIIQSVLHLSSNHVPNYKNVYPRPLHPSLSSTSRLRSPSRSPFISGDIESGSSIFCVRNTQKQTNIAQQSHKKNKKKVAVGVLSDNGGGGVKQKLIKASKREEIYT